MSPKDNELSPGNDDGGNYPNGHWTLKRCREWLDENKEEGVTCPLCNQFAKVYRRKLDKAMIHALTRIFSAGGYKEYVHAPTLLSRYSAPDGVMGKLSYHGLVQELEIKRDDGGRAGYWRITDLGLAFMRGASLPKYAIVYAGRVITHLGPEITITEVAPQFRLDDLMNGI